MQRTNRIERPAHFFVGILVKFPRSLKDISKQHSSACNMLQEFCIHMDWIAECSFALTSRNFNAPIGSRETRGTGAVLRKARRNAS